jgi:hypothetical protein
MRNNDTGFATRISVASSGPRRLAPALWLVLAFALAGCAASAVTAGSGQTPVSSTSSKVSVPTPSYLGAVKQPSMDRAGILLDPPTAGQKAGVTWQYAFRFCQRDGGCPSGAKSATVTLALVTDHNSGTALPDGSIKPFINHTLTYVVTFSGYQCLPHGGGVQASKVTPVPAPTYKNCSDINYVSAQTGDDMYEVQVGG